MHRIFYFTFLWMILAAAGCFPKPSSSVKPTNPIESPLGYTAEHTIQYYTRPESSQLSAIRPYPNNDDVCMTLQTNNITRKLVSANAVLIGCPKHEKGAISARLREGATIVDHAQHWSVLSAPIKVLGFGSEPTISSYTEPERSRLNAIRPYPNDDDVCMTLHKDSVTDKLVSDNAVLIGCPTHEKGAISNRLGEGGTVIAHALHWSLLSVPKRESDSNAQPTSFRGAQSEAPARNWSLLTSEPFTGVWAVENSNWRRPNALKGSVIYLGEAGLGVLAGGPPPIGAKIDFKYDASTHLIYYRIFDDEVPVASGFPMKYDPDTDSITIKGKAKDWVYQRESDDFPEDLRSAMKLK